MTAPTTGTALDTGEAGPECETCGKTTCPDADLPAFSEPKQCEYAPVFHAIRDAKDCDYGCSRDYTNRAITLWVAPAVERIVAARVAAAAVQARAEVVARVEAALALVDEWEDTQAYNREHIGSMLFDTPTPADFRAALAGPNPRDGQDGGGE